MMLHRSSLFVLAALAACDGAATTNPFFDDTGDLQEIPEVPRDDTPAVDSPSDDTDVPTPTGDACADGRAAFVADVYEPVMGELCVACHSAGSLAGDTRLVLDPTDMAASFETAWAVASTVEHGMSLLVAKPSGQHPDGHGGGLRAAVGSAEHAAIAAFAAQTLTTPYPCADDTTADTGSDDTADTAADDSADTGDTDTSGLDTGDTSADDTADTAVDDTGDTDTAGVDTDDTGACRDDRTAFEQDLWTPVLQARCTSCHIPGGFAGGTAFVLTPGGTDLDGDFATAAAVAAMVDDGVSILASKPTNTHANGHAGGRQVVPGSADHQAILDFIDRIEGTHPCADVPAVGDDSGLVDDSADTDLDPQDSADDDPVIDSGDDPVDTGDSWPVPDPVCGPDDLLPRRVRRLSHVAYDRTIQDLLGLDSDFGTTFATDVEVDGFLENADALTVGPLLADQYRDAAEQLAFDPALDLDALVPCDPDLIGAQDCGSAFLVDFGRRAFRRPITVTEHDRFHGFFREVLLDEDFDAAVRWSIAAFLQSPSFLYRLEMGVSLGDGTFVLTDHELATQLSYLLWQSMPDDELLDLADASELADPTTYDAQVARMLADPRADGTMGRFTEQWLHLDRLTSAFRDPNIFPGFSDEVRTAMRGETERFVEDLFVQGGTVGDLYLAEHTFLTPSLAAFYGLPAPSQTDAEGFGRVDLAMQPQVGLLSQGALLATYSNPQSSSPVHRGVAVRERLLCQDLPPPPPGLDLSPPDVDPNATTRERYQQHRTDAACAGCHDLIDPVGFGFEHYDGVGRYRADEGGLAIDASGEVRDLGGADVPFDDVPGLATVLGHSEVAEACYVTQWIRYGLGVGEDGATDCRVDATTDAFRTAGGQLSDAVLVLARDPSLASRAGGLGEGDTPGTSDWAVPLDDEVDVDPDAVDTSEPVDTGDPLDTGDPRIDVDLSDDFSLEVDVTSDWGGGYCANLRVTNDGPSEASWLLIYDVGGTIYNNWNADAVDDGGGEYAFTGVGWNASLPAGATAHFGFCANR